MYIDANKLIEACNKAQKNSSWKYSVQKFSVNLLRNITELKESLEHKTYRQKPFREFIQNERGKIRPIRAMAIEDRIVQRYIYDNVLIPNLRKDLIYDNGASLEGRGVDFSRKRLQCHLEKYYRKHGNKGYVLKIDFSKFFDNIPHDKLIERLRKKKELSEYMDLIEYLIRCFSPTVDASFDTLKPFDSTDNRKAVINDPVILPRSLGIGSQISQIFGVWYVTPIDTWCKNVLGLKYYGRYMDDIYILHPDKKYLTWILKEFNKKSRELGLFVNPKKTQIINIKKGFTFLNISYQFTDTGHIIKRISKKSFIRMRRRLKKFRGLMLKGAMSYDMIRQAYLSWRGNVKRFHYCFHSLNNIDMLYQSLFPLEEILYG